MTSALDRQAIASTAMAAFAEIPVDPSGSVPSELPHEFEVTDDMLFEGERVFREGESLRENLAACYRAMREAAVERLPEGSVVMTPRQLAGFERSILNELADEREWY